MTSQGVLKPGDRVEAGQVLYVHGKQIVISELNHRTRMLAYHKAEGEISTHKDPANVVGCSTPYQVLKMVAGCQLVDLTSIQPD